LFLLWITRVLSASANKYGVALKAYICAEALSFPGVFLYLGADFVPAPVIFAITAPSPALLAVIGARTADFLDTASTAAGVVFLIIRLCAAALPDFDFSAGPAFFKEVFLISGLRTTDVFLSTDCFADDFTEVFFGGIAFFTATFFAGVFFFATTFFTGAFFLEVDFFCAIKPSSKIFVNFSNMKRQK